MRRMRCRSSPNTVAWLTTPSDHSMQSSPSQRLAIAGEPRRDRADAAVDRMADGLPRPVDIVLGRLVVHEQDVVEAAGDQQAGEGAQPGEPALAFILVQARMPEAGRRMPADRHAAILAVGDVQRPVDQHGEAQAGAGAEFEQADAALDAVAQRHQPHAGELRQANRRWRRCRGATSPSVEFDHFCCSC